MKLRLTLNGDPREAEIAPAESLLAFLRRAGCTSVKYGCGTGDCGACTVLVDGQAVISCVMLAAKADGRAVRTMEGWRADRALEVLAEAFVERAAVQCGYCIPGMILTARALLAEDPEPREEKIRHALAGNLCRCTGYVKPIQAVQQAARRLCAERPADHSS